MAGLDSGQGHRPDAQKNLFLFAFPPPGLPYALLGGVPGKRQRMPSRGPLSVGVPQGWGLHCSATCKAQQGLRGPEKASGTRSQGTA